MNAHGKIHITELWFGFQALQECLQCKQGDLMIAKDGEQAIYINFFFVSRTNLTILTYVSDYIITNGYVKLRCMQSIYTEKERN